MKRVLIISPFFPPSNAADMQRIRTSLPYFQDFGWQAEVVSVGDKHAEMVKDDLLIRSIPAEIKIHKIKALNKRITSKFGLGSLAFRSMWHYRKKVNEILKKEKFDLVYFSTTQFPVCILGYYWKKRFNIPYVIDMQDPWYSEHYKEKPKKQRPPKYRFVYGLHKLLEAKTMATVDGLISVSDSYIKDLKTRYPSLEDVPSATITFGAFAPDIKIADENRNGFTSLLGREFINIVYAGRGGMDMYKAIIPVFKALKKGLENQPELFIKLKFYFIGTSYAPAGKGEATILPLAKKYGIEGSVIEITNRIGYYYTLLTLQQADGLFIPGSDDPSYTASKIYPYLLTKKPFIAVFNKNSSAVTALRECTENAVILTFDTPHLTDILYEVLANWGNSLFTPVRLSQKFEKYSARNLTGLQTQLFTKAIAHFETKNTNP